MQHAKRIHCKVVNLKFKTHIALAELFSAMNVGSEWLL